MSDNFKYANAFVQNKPVYLKDTDKYEKEMDTSLEDPEGNKKPEDTLLEENPNSPKDSTVDDSHNWEKRYSDLKSYMDKQLNAFKTKSESVEQKNLELQQKLKDVESKPKQYPVSEAEIAQWAAEFPDFNKTLITIVSKIVDDNNKDLRQEMVKLEEASKAIAAEKGWQELLKLHPDANALVNDPQFNMWFAQQTPRIRALIESTNPKEIAKGIDLYKVEMNIKPVQKVNQDKEASKAVTTNSKPDAPKEKKRWSESQVKKMGKHQFERLEAEIDLARAEGRFDYDLSSF